MGENGDLERQEIIPPNRLEVKHTGICPPSRQPLILIRPGKKWAPLDLKSLWAYRELLYFLTWRDVKLRYKQTVLGATWAVIQPLFTMLIFYLFFGRLAKISSDGIPYPLFAFAGLLPWTFFSNAVASSGNSLVASSYLITKVYFPRVLIPAAAVTAGLVDLAIAFVMMIVLMMTYGVQFQPAVMLVPALVLLTAVFALAVGLFLSAMNVRYRDIRFVIPFLVQLWMFGSPVIYPLSLVPPKWRWLLELNPMTGIIEAYRAALFGKVMNMSALAISSGLALLLLICSAFFFRRMERSFADTI